MSDFLWGVVVGAVMVLAGLAGWTALLAMTRGR